MESGDTSFERTMSEIFPELHRERVIYRQVAAAAIFTFYMVYSPGIHAEERKEVFSISGLLPRLGRKQHRFSCEE